MNKETGGPAFPFPVLHGRGAPEGMALRDYFAAKAMQALIEKYECELAIEIAQEAYDYADAMLEARK